MRAPIFLLLGVMGLGAWTSACRIAWGSWSSCSRSCGGGKKTRTCDWGGTQSESCNEFCYNGNSYNGGCRCSAWRTGYCCEGCRYPGIAKCKPGKYECGGSPDGIRCTDCYLPYKPAGFNKGCVRKPCNENNGGCSHLCTAERLTRCTCRAGYQLSSDEYSCIDTNECATHNGQCDQICTNSPGSYSCSCGPGFVLAYGNRLCNDIDECLTGTARCGHQCVNTNGSFKCTCDSGYRLNPDGLTCDDIDECKIGNGGCAHVCENIAGSYKCSCDTGYALHDGAHLCKDIDECDSGVSACSQICMNKNGTYHCECEAGFYLDNDTVTCKNINDCNAVVCENGGECVDGIEQYSCECQPGFSGKLCQDDVNECEGVFKGGCEDICVNTFGSYLCQCRDNVTLKSDGFSCSYDGEREDVFTRYSIGGRLLPKGCSKVAFKLESGTESTFWSTSEWYRLNTNGSVVFTSGVVFLDSHHVSIPISLSGLQVVNTSGSGFIVSSDQITFSVQEGTAIGNANNNDCLNINPTFQDIRDFQKSMSFMKSFFKGIDEQMPNWMRLFNKEISGTGLQDMRTHVLKGSEIARGRCSGAPLTNDKLYAVLLVTTSFSIEIYDQVAILPTRSSQKDDTVCFIIDTFEDDEWAIFILLPESLQDILHRFDMFKQIFQRYKIEIRPKGIGLSLKKSINVQSAKNSMQFWNGDELFSYSVPKEASFWIKGDIVSKHEFFTTTATVETYISIPSPSVIMRSIFEEEWDIVATIRSKQDNDKIMIEQLKLRGKTDVDARASLGGHGMRQLCGEYSNPKGLFIALSISRNPFENIPVLSVLSINLMARVYAFITISDNDEQPVYLPTSIIARMRTTSQILKNIQENTIPYIRGHEMIMQNFSTSALTYFAISTAKLTHVMNETVAAIEIQTNLNAWIVQRITNIWENEYLMFKRSVQEFLESIEFNARAMAFNLSKELENTISDVSYSFSEIITTISNELVSGFSDFSGSGLQFYGGINIFGLPIRDIDFEYVKSVEHVGKCSKFKEVFELFKDEDAYRIFGKYTKYRSQQLGIFIRFNRGDGFGYASNKNGTKIQGHFHAEVSILFLSVFTDVFFNNNGLFMYFEILLANLFKTNVSVHAAWGSSWNELTFGVKATFRADGSGDGSFQDSYSSAITRAISDMSYIAFERIASAKNEINNAQRSIDRAKQWLSSKQREVRSANEEFDKAISKLEDAKSALEHAKKPFQQALEKVENAQQKLDRLCKLKDCKQICVPGPRLTTCTRSDWGGKISYPCIKWSGCIYSFSDPVCIAENLACSVIRAPALLVLEGAQLLLRVPMLLFDAAKAAVSVAQVVVDKSRVVLLAAENLLEIAKISMDATSAVLESAKQALEALNFVLRLGVAAMNYIIENGIDAIVEIRNCGFETAIRTKDVGIFDIFCEINPFRLGWKKLRLKVNINDMVRSIWNAAKATAETILNMLTGRKKRAVEFNTKSAFYTLLRKARNIDLSNSTFEEFINQSIDTVSTTMGFRKSDAADDYDYRTEIFKTKCEIFSKVWLYLMEATYVAFNVSSGTEGEFLEPESLTKYSNITNRTLSLYDIGVDINVAATEFNMSISDLELLLEEARKNISSDNQLVEIQEMSNVYSKVMTSQKNETSTMEITMFWVHIMDNISRDFYEEDTCINFMDCMHYSITILYELFDAENITNMEQSLETISEIENLLLNITTEHTITSNEVFKIANNLNANLTLLKELNVFCSTPPVMQSQLQNQTGSTGTRITLLCDVTGNPMPSVTWYKKSNLLVNETLKMLTIQNASSDDAGVYHCLSSNIVATIASNDAWIHVLEPEEAEVPAVIDKPENEDQHEDTVVVATSTAVAGVAAIVLAVVVTYLYRRSRCQMFNVRQPKIAMRTQQAE